MQNLNQLLVQTDYSSCLTDDTDGRYNI